MSREFKPCPFCGQQPSVFSVGEHYHYVICYNEDCDVNPRVEKHGQFEAKMAWNLRFEE